MLRINLNLFCIILITVFVSGCKKYREPPQENLGFFSLGEAKDYLLFKPGTWWVYKNSFTNERDTMILTSCAIDTVKAESELRVFTYENIGYVIKSLRDNCTYSTYNQGMSPEVSNFYAGWSFDCTRSNGYYSNYYSGSGLSCQFYFPFDKGRSRGNGVYETTFFENIDSLSINSKTFYNIAVFVVTKDNSFPYPNMFFEDHSNSTYYWAKNIGLIKIEMVGWDKNDVKVLMNWNLVESHIYK